MGDLTPTFGGLIIFAHRANIQSLYKTATIHIYTRYIYDMISYYSNVAYSMRRYSMINIKYYYTFICSLRAWLKSRIRKLRPYN